MIKVKNKKGFTIVELLGVIIILSVLFFIAVPAVSKYYTKSKMKAYYDLEKTMKSSATNYLLEYSSEIPNNIGDIKEITLKTLIDTRYVEDIVDLDQKDIKCDYDKSKVIVTRVEVIKDDPLDNTIDNIKLDYKVCLVCSNYSSNSCE